MGLGEVRELSRLAEDQGRVPRTLARLVPGPPQRVVAVGDVHGDFDSAREALRLAGAIDSHDDWIGGRMIVVHEAQRTSGFGGELAAIVAEKALEYLEAPIKRVTGFDTPFPYTLEDVYMPDADRVLRAILKTSRYVG